MNYRNSTGFGEDSAALLAEFSIHKSSRFEDFCAIWKRLNFQYIFYGHDLDASLVQFTGDALLVAKHQMLGAAADKTITDSIGALYLLYAIYFKQPSRQYCKIRCTQSEWQRVRDLHTALLAVQPQYEQARLILWKLIGADAFRFVECETECGFEAYLLSADRQAGGRRFASINHRMAGELRSLRHTDGDGGLVPALQLLQAGYNEMKIHLNGSASGDDALLQPTTVLDDIVAGIANVEKIFDMETAEADSADGEGQPSAVLAQYSIGERRQRLKAGAGEAVAAAAAVGSVLEVAAQSDELRQEAKAKRVYMRRHERALLLNEAHMEDVRRVDEQEEKQLLSSCMRLKEEEDAADKKPTTPTVRVVPVSALAAKPVRKRRLRQRHQRTACNPHKICVLNEQELHDVLQTPGYPMQYVSCRNGPMRVQLHQHTYEFVCNKSGDHYYRCVETVSASACGAHILVRGALVYVIEGQHTHAPAATTELPELGAPVPVLPIVVPVRAAAVEPASATAESQTELLSDPLAAPSVRGDLLKARMAGKLQQLQKRSAEQKK